ncbi:hypothetical protein D3C81_2008200 [compost metagenome]
MLTQILPTRDTVALPFCNEVQRRVHLCPAGFILERVVAFVQGTDEGKKAIVVLDACADAHAEVVILTAHRFLVRTTIGDRDHHGFAPVLGASAHHVYGVGRFVLVQLI